MQAWKKSDKAWGRYRAQYVWRCTRGACRNTVLEPGWLPAAAAIDWTLTGERIGDRTKPLAAKTMQRIAAGLAHYATPELLIPVEGREGKTAAPSSEAMRTMTTRNETGLLVPAGGTWNEAATSLGEVMRTRTTRESEALVAPLRNNNTTKTLVDPFDTFAAAGNHHGLLMPYYGNATSRATHEPHGTFTTRDRYALIMHNNSSKQGGAEMCTPETEPLRTLTTAGHQSLLESKTPTVADCLFRMLEPHEIAAEMAFTNG